MTNNCLLPKRNNKRNLNEFDAELVLNPHYLYCSRVLIKYVHDVMQLLTSVKVNTYVVTEQRGRGASRSWNVSKFVCLRAKIQIDRLSNNSHSFMTLCVKTKITQ